jgi:hypothetical protein
MRCPKCGNNLIEFKCARCGFDVKKDEIVCQIGTYSNAVQLIEKYIRENEEAKAAAEKEAALKRAIERAAAEHAAAEKVAAERAGAERVVAEREEAEKAAAERAAAEEAARLAAEKDRQAASRVTALIDNIGSVEDTEECGQKLSDARSAYYALTSSQTVLVKNEWKLTAAQKEFDLLKDASSLIDKIGRVEPTVDFMERLGYARAAFDKLTPAQKEHVTNRSKLTAATKELTLSQRRWQFKRAFNKDLNERYKKKHSSEIPPRPRKRRPLSVVEWVLLIILFLGCFFCIITVADYHGIINIGIVDKEQVRSTGADNASGGSPSLFSVGDVITLGRYEQDGNPENGAEDICWEVKEIAGNKALLVSKYALDAAPFHYSTADNVTWESSSLRGWLNSYFLDAAFSDEEQSLIIQSNLETPEYSWDGEKLTKLSNVENTTDMVFIEEIGASVSDASSYSLQALMGYGRSAVQLNDDVFPSKWLRNPVICETNEIYNVALGYSEKSRQLISSQKKFALVCPAMYIDLSAYETYMVDDHFNEKSKLTCYYEACDAVYQSGLEQGLYKQVLVSDRCIYCLKNDGTIEVFGYQYQWGNPVPLEIDYSKWTDIESLTVLDGGTLELFAMARSEFIVNERGIAALRKDGTVLVLSSTFQGTVDAANWTDIIQITTSSGDDLFGLQRDGTAHYILVKPPWTTNEELQDELSDLDGSAKIFAVQMKGGAKIFGLSENGTILYKKDNSISTYDKTIGGFIDIISNWSNLKDVAVCRLQSDIVGLMNNGKVLYGGSFGYGGDSYTLDESVIDSWEDVISIAAGYSHLVGLREDGTVYAVGKNDYGQCNIEGWTNIERVAAFGVSTVGYREDGSILVAGNNPIESILSAPFSYENSR